MIRLVTGPLRGGKTSYCVSLAIQHLAKGGTVFTNIAFNFDECAKLIAIRYRVVIIPQQIVQVDLVKDKDWTKSIKWGKLGHSVLCLWDEIHLHFNSRKWAETQKLYADMLGFLSQSGKCFVDIIFICQVGSQLEKQFRDQCELEFYCRAVNTITIPFFGKLPLNKMLLVERDKNTDKALSRVLIGRDKAIWKCYDSFSFLDANMIEASATMDRIEHYKLERIPLVSRSVWISLAFAGVVLALFTLLR